MLFAVRFALWFLISLVPLTVQAAKVSVKLVDQLETPLPGVEVKLVHESAREIFRKAGKNTELEFEPTDKGTFYVMAQRKGYLTIKSDPFTVEDKDVQLKIKLVDLNHFRKIEAAGKVAFEQGQYQEALQHFQTLNSLVPTEPVTWSNLARCHAMLRQRDQAVRLCAGPLLTIQFNLEPISRNQFTLA
jgi:tetratricopeptide (TPR) repeat protein